ncbi:hypothetical protein M569_04519, partial [Genlisea aurea]
LGTDDEQHPLFLVLSATDPLYKKKKKLLEQGGVDVESPIILRSSSTEEQLKAIADQLLLLARIIHLNEVELYFEESSSDHGNLFSPRNELEALNSILEVLD